VDETGAFQPAAAAAENLDCCAFGWRGCGLFAHQHSDVSVRSSRVLVFLGSGRWPRKPWFYGGLERLGVFLRIPVRNRALFQLVYAGFFELKETSRSLCRRPRHRGKRSPRF